MNLGAPELVLLLGFFLVANIVLGAIIGLVVYVIKATGKRT